MKSLVSYSLALMGIVFVSQSAQGDDVPATTQPAAAVCPVSGKAIGSMGPGYTINYEGREVTFCCEGCESEFRDDPATYLKKLDAQKPATTQPAESSSEDKKAD